MYCLTILMRTTDWKLQYRSTSSRMSLNSRNSYAHNPLGRRLFDWPRDTLPDLGLASPFTAHRSKNIRRRFIRRQTHLSRTDLCKIHSSDLCSSSEDVNLDTNTQLKHRSVYSKGLPSSVLSTQPLHYPLSGCLRRSLTHTYNCYFSSQVPISPVSLSRFPSPQ